MLDLVTAEWAAGRDFIFARDAPPPPICPFEGLRARHPQLDVAARVAVAHRHAARTGEGRITDTCQRHILIDTSAHIVSTHRQHTTSLTRQRHVITHRQ
jgi:hypothetical protein